MRAWGFSFSFFLIVVSCSSMPVSRERGRFLIATQDNWGQQGPLNTCVGNLGTVQSVMGFEEEARKKSYKEGQEGGGGRS